MKLPRNWLWLAQTALAVCLCLPAAAVTLEVHNPQGDVRVKVDPSPRLRIEGLGANRSAGRDDIKTTRLDQRIVVRCEPTDGEQIDLDVQLPLGFDLEVITTKGNISVDGMLRRAFIETNTGEVQLKLPWRTTRLRLDADEKPKDLTTPPGFKFTKENVKLDPTKTVWRLSDDLDEQTPIYGELRVRARTPPKVVLENFQIPSSWPLKMPWQAPEALDEILSGRAQSSRSATPPPPPPPISTVTPAEPAVPAEEGAAVFTSDVRLVNLTLTVTDQFGRPVTGLQPEDFRVIEDQKAQKVTHAGSDNVPFNLAILLDLSGSTRPDREAMQAVTERFIALLGPEDKVAVYALAGGMFHVVSELTKDRQKLLNTINHLPAVSGASPLYDTMVLAYAEELVKRQGERNALIVISDGIDNQLSRQESPSKVNYKKFVKAVGEIDALLYPIFLKSGERFGRGWSEKARFRMEELAGASGGKVFPAASIRDLDPVFPQLEQELRSVYSVAYYPENQNFDGTWRNVVIEVNRPGVIIRARPGYYAR